MFYPPDESETVAPQISLIKKRLPRNVDSYSMSTDLPESLPRNVDSYSVSTDLPESLHRQRVTDSYPMFLGLLPEQLAEHD